MSTLPVKLQPGNLRPIAYRIFSKKHGLNIKTDALQTLTEIISYHFGSEWKGAESQSFMEEMAKMWKNEDRGLFLDGEGLRNVSKELHKRKNSREASEEPALDWRDHFKIVNPPDMPRFRFDRSRKQFSLEKKGGLQSNLHSAVTMYRNRYEMLADRLSRHESFQKSSGSFVSGASFTPSTEISLIKNVVGRDNSVFVLFGQLSKNNNGDYILEDSSDHIELDLSQAEKVDGFFTTGMFVVVEGIYSASGGHSNTKTDYIGGVFHVSMVGHPPAERRAVEMDNYGNVDFLGVHEQSEERVTKVSKAFHRKIGGLEVSLDHRVILLGSDCFLDSSQVLEKLKKTFATIEESIDSDGEPLAIVMAGSFVSRPMVHGTEAYKSGFDNLAQLLSEYPSIVNRCTLVLMAGKNDPWQSTQSLGSANANCLPQSSIPRLFVNRLDRLFPRGRLVLGWNPLRISYLTQEWVFFSSNLMTKLKRNNVQFASDSKEETAGSILEEASKAPVSHATQQARRLVKTILDQGHLQPFSIDLKLVNPTYDHALRIEPMPSVLFLYDSSVESFEVTYNGCKVVNVGAFGGYLEYFPGRKRFERH